jgi:2-polyprenyl-3-methyl-5-hydroxy-6-metoxy-1,4-benzoquinol methylase
MEQETKPQDQFKTPQDIMNMMPEMWKTRTVLTGFELGVFTILDEDKKTSADVAQTLGADARATDRLLNALCAIGLLEKSAGLFANTPFSARFLVKGKPEYLGGIMHTVNLWETWSTLTAAVRAGKAVYQLPALNERNDAFLTGFIAAMHGRAYRAAPGIVALTPPAPGARVLDVGGGSAAYSMAFARAAQGVTATVFDLSSVVPITRGYIEREGLADRIDTTTGDFNKDPLPTGFDIVFLSQVLHSNSMNQNRALLKKAANALNPGGRVVVQEFIVDEDRTGPAFNVLFALNMLIGTPEGDTFTESEVSGWMAEAGLVDVKRIDTSIDTTLLIGWKR